MSIIEVNVVDAIGISKDSKNLILMISDHLDWNNEADHLFALQSKINSYLGFIESKQYNETYPHDIFESYIIDLRFKFKITAKCLEFIEVLNRQLDEFNIFVEVSEEGT